MSYKDLTLRTSLTVYYYLINLNIFYYHKTTTEKNVLFLLKCISL